jgi:hypothetical protein
MIYLLIPLLFGFIPIIQAIQSPTPITVDFTTLLLTAITPLLVSLLKKRLKTEGEVTALLSFVIVAAFYTLGQYVDNNGVLALNSAFATGLGAAWTLQQGIYWGITAVANASTPETPVKEKSPDITTHSGGTKWREYYPELREPTVYTDPNGDKYTLDSEGNKWRYKEPAPSPVTPSDYFPRSGTGTEPVPAKPTDGSTKYPHFNGEGSLGGGSIESWAIPDDGTHSLQDKPPPL